MTKENPMKKLKIEKVTLHVGCSGNPDDVKKGIKLLSTITGRKVVQTIAKSRIAAWKLRPGLPIGAKVTVAKENGVKLLKRLLEAVEFTLKPSCFTENGFSFGIKEYIDVEGMRYDPQLGMMGFDVCISMGRPGFRVKRRKTRPSKVGNKHRVTREDVMEFVKKELGVKFDE